MKRSRSFQGNALPPLLLFLNNLAGHFRGTAKSLSFQFRQDSRFARSRAAGDDVEVGIFHEKYVLNSSGLVERFLVLQVGAENLH